MFFEPLLTGDVWWLVVNKRRRLKMTHKNRKRKRSINLIFLKRWMFSFEACRLPLQLVHPLSRPRDKSIAILSIKNSLFPLYFFFQFQSSKTWIRIRIHLKCWIRIRIQSATLFAHVIRIKKLKDLYLLHRQYLQKWSCGSGTLFRSYPEILA